MSKIKLLLKNVKPDHERTFNIQSYPVKGNRLVVEGWLRDERLVDGYHWHGEPRPKGVVHLIGVRLLVGGWPLSILDAEAEMKEIPHPLCPETIESVGNLVGVTISGGFSEKVRTLIGGIEGCAHMTNLILAMGPAALHGYWTHHSRKPQPLPETEKDLPGLKYLIGSCKLWKEDGPFVQIVKETVKRKEKRVKT